MHMKIIHKIYISENFMYARVKHLIYLSTHKAHIIYMRLEMGINNVSI